MKNPFKMDRWEWRWAMIDSRRILLQNLRSSIPQWSSLRTVGSSRIVSATMIAPFLGTLILFNQAAVDLLRIPDEVMNAFHLQSVVGSVSWSLARLKLTYFGLVMLGFASFAFAIFCPRVVKRYPSAAEYIEGDRSLFTPPRTSSAAVDAMIAYDDRTRVVEEWREATFSYPDALLHHFETVFGEIGSVALKDDETADEVEAPEDAASEHEPDEAMISWHEEHRLHDRMTGTINVSKLVNLMRSGRQADRWYHDVVIAEARNHVTDIMALDYGTADAWRPLVRLVVMALFGAGFALLSVPTMMTFLAVLRATL